MPSTAELLQLAEKSLLPNYRKPAMVLSHGQGARVWDTDGKVYWDLYAGIAVSALGHNHPELVQAIATQAARLVHTSNYFHNDVSIELAAELCKRSGLDKVFFTNSGTEAIEAALKLARRFHFAKGDGKRLGLVATHQAFHGRSMGAVSLTGQPKYWEGFGAPIAEVSHVPYGALDAMARRINDQTAAVFVEPIQGEGGVLPAPEGYLAGLRQLCTERGALLVLDEIQTGFGRTGAFLCCQHEGVLPDLVAVAKGIAGGVPMGALLVKETFAQALPPGSHGTTFGGGPLAAAAALAVLRVLDRDQLLDRARALGTWLLARLEAIVAKHPKVCVGARGRGLMCGLVLADSVDPRAVLGTLRERGVLLSQAGDKVLRFVPPLVIAQDDLEAALTVVDEVLSTVETVGASR